MSQSAPMMPEQVLAAAIHDAGAKVAPDPLRQPLVAEEGLKTTEFWVTVITMIIGCMVAFRVMDDKQGQAIAALVSLVVPQAFYALGRSIRKQGTNG